MIAPEVATAEVNKWLDYKKLSEKRRTERKLSIDALVEAVSDGIISIDDDYNIKQPLIFPIADKEGNVALSEVVYKPRLTYLELEKYTKGIAADDVDGKIFAYGAALTGKAIGLLKKMETEDFILLQKIALFFI